MIYGVTARRKRNVRRMNNLHALRQQRREQRHVTGSVSCHQAEGNEISGKLVIEAKSINKSYDDTSIIKDLDIRIARGDSWVLLVKRIRKNYALESFYWCH